MSTQAERLLRIEHPDGRRYAVTEDVYKHRKMFGDQTYQDAGFNVVSYEDGTPFEEGKEPTAYALVSTARSPEIGTVEEAASDAGSAPTSSNRSRTSAPAEAAPAPATAE